MARTKQSARYTRPPTPIPKPLDPLPPNTLPILRTGPEAVAYHIPVSISPSPPSLSKTTISLPRHSRWTSSLHFHTSHTEYLHLLRGAIFVQLDNSTRIYSAEAGGQIHERTGELVKPGLVVEIPRYVRHEWGRAEGGGYSGRRIGRAGIVQRAADVDDEVVVEEWTDPADADKAGFFWNLNGIVNAAADAPLPLLQRMVRGVLGAWWIPFQLFVVFWELDNWPVFARLGYYEGRRTRWENADEWCRRRVEEGSTWVLLLLAKVLGWVVGVRAVEQSRTPEGLWRGYQAQRA